MKINELNILALAYLGDSIYEIYVRKFLIGKGIVKVKELQAEAIKYVSAKGQAHYLKIWIKSELLKKDELEIVGRARNHKGNRHPKNTDILTYKHATALEALIGFWYLKQNFERLNEMMALILEEQTCTYMEKM
ncbi:MAG: ribonuclease III [Bacilli bacterium]|nr:ribonuclease III [Bacilli bacterium]